MAESLEQRTLLSSAAAHLIDPLWFQTAPEAAAPPVGPAPPTQSWIVQFDPQIVADYTSVALTSTLLLGMPGGFQVVKGLGGTGQVLVQTWGAAPEAAAGWFAANTAITSFEPDSLVSIAAFPNDTSFGTLWGLHNIGQSGGTVDADIDAPEAWDLSTGDDSIIVAVIDTGIDYNHPDLAANMWVNPGEIAGDQIDNDGNGFIDDIYGWDFVNNDNNPLDDNNHGTHVAGTIGAAGNNGTGVVGVNWDVSLMALKFLNAQGNGSTSGAIAAVNYATMMRDRGHNVQVTNNSWGGGGYSQELYDAIAASGERGMLFVAAAGNNGSNNDSSPNYPSSYDLDNVIAVAATTRTDALASYSNYGLSSVDLAAPGSSILSTVRNGGYSTFNGTSMATPHVAGAAALAWSVASDATYREVRDALLAGAVPISSLSGRVATGSRLNAYHTLQLLLSPPATPVNYFAVATALESVNLVAGSAVVATLLDNADDAATALDLGAHSFTFYGTTYTGPASLFVSTNGLITFGSGNTQYVPTNLASFPEQAAIAPLWNDLVTNFDGADQVLTRFDDLDGDTIADRLVIEWSDVRHYSATGSPATFQAILGLNTGAVDGDIIFNYVDLDFGLAGINNGGAATVGLRDTGVQGLERVLVSEANAFHPLVGSGRAIHLDRARPTAVVGDVAPDPTSESVDFIDLVFSEPLTGGTLGLADLTLTRDGGANLIGSGVTITPLGPTTYRVGGLAGLTGVDGTYLFSLNLAGVRDAAGHAGQGTASEQWVRQSSAPADPDIRVLSAVTNGLTTLTVTYQIVAPGAAPGAFDLSFVRSGDAAFGGDVLLATVAITDPADRTAGTHVKSWSIGSTAGAIPLPGAGATEVDEDYFLLVVADPANAIVEDDAHPFSEDNTAVVTGVYHAPKGLVLVQGGPGVDTVTVSGSISVNLNGTISTYAANDVSGLRVRTHGGDDVIDAAALTKAVRAWGGDGDDWIAGGAIADLLFGGPGNDMLFGNAGNDTLSGDAGDDLLHGGSGGDTYLFDADTPLGHDFVNESGSGADTLDFSATTSVPLSIHLGLTTMQTVASTLQLTLSAGNVVENVVGGALGDSITGNSLANVITGGGGDDLLAGGSGGDTYLFDADSPLGHDRLTETATGGADTLNFSATGSLGVTVNLSLATQQTVNGNLQLTLSAGNVFENLIGGSQADTLTGNSLANRLTGGPGDDTLAGGLGDDTYLFDADGPLGIDTLIEAAGEGSDWLDFSATTTLGVSVDLASTTLQTANSHLQLWLSSGASFENIVGTSRNDWLSGNALHNTLIGGAGADTLLGLAGRDLLVGGTSADTLQGGDDDDLVIADTLTYYKESNQSLNRAAISALLAEWLRLDADYATRIAHLRSGGGLNGSHRVNSTTVLSDGAAIDQLFGDGGLDWFWSFGDVTNDVGLGGAETVN